jgi:protein SCO1/2
MKTFLLSMVVIATAWVAFTVETYHFQAFTTESKRRLHIAKHSQPLQNTDLETHFDKIIHWDEFQGKFVIVDFIYTRCVTLCSVLGAEFFQIQQQAADLIQQEKLQLLSISFDGGNDTPSQLHAYIKRFTKDAHSWIGARASEKYQQQSLLDEFGITVIPIELGDYIHNASLHLISPDGRLIKIVDYDEAHELITEIRYRLDQPLLISDTYNDESRADLDTTNL